MRKEKELEIREEEFTLSKYQPSLIRQRCEAPSEKNPTVGRRGEED